jgi:hypothetical protein
MLVSGNMVGGRQYFEGFADQFVSGLPQGEDADNEFTRKAFAGYGDIYKTDNEDAVDDGQVSSLERIQFIHLKDARFLYNARGNALPSKGAFGGVEEFAR